MKTGFLPAFPECSLSPATNWGVLAINEHRARRKWWRCGRGLFLSFPLAVDRRSCVLGLLSLFSVRLWEPYLALIHNHRSMRNVWSGFFSCIKQCPWNNHVFSKRNTFVANFIDLVGSLQILFIYYNMKNNDCRLRFMPRRNHDLYDLALQLNIYPRI